MHTPLEIHFHGIEKSEAVEERVREKVSKLEKHFGRMTRCRVVLEVPHRSPQKPKVFQIKIEISLPRRQPIVVCHEREGATPTRSCRSPSATPSRPRCAKWTTSAPSRSAPSWSAAVAVPRPTATTAPERLFSTPPEELGEAARFPQCAALRNTVEAMSPAAMAIATVMRP